MDFPKSVPGVGLVGGVFVDENQVTGQQGSLIPAAWGNSVTQEILSVLQRSGIAPDEAAFDQLANAIFDSPTFGANAKGTTPSQFDTSTKLATMAAVQRALGSYSGQANYTANVVLTAADSGKLVVLTGGAAATLPLSSAVGEGTLITVFASAASCVVQKQGVDTLSAQGGEPGPFTITANSLAVFRRLKGGGGWAMDSGDFALKYSPGFGSMAGLSGYQRLPSGIIIQWGLGGLINAGGSMTITRPITFPNAALLTIVGNSTSAGGASYYSTLGVQYVDGAQFKVYAMGAGQPNVPWISIGH